MKKLFTIMGLLLSLNLMAQDFEGTIVMDMDIPEGQPDMEMTFFVKADKFAMVMSDPTEQEIGEMRVIMDKESNAMIMVIEGEETMAMKYDLDVLKEMQDKVGELAPDGDTKDAEVSLSEKGKFTGKTKTIDGFLCKEYVGGDDEMDVQMWVNEEIDLNMEEMFPQTPGQKGSSSPFGNSGPREGFPMEMTATNKTNGEVMKIKSKVNREKVDSKMFEVPEGIEVMDMSFLMQMMQEGGK